MTTTKHIVQGHDTIALEQLAGVTGGDGPQSGAGGSVPSQVRDRSYKVQPGDNLTRIARAQRTTVNSLLLNNHFNEQHRNPDLIHPGEQIVVDQYIADPKGHVRMI